MFVGHQIIFIPLLFCNTTRLIIVAIHIYKKLKLQLIYKRIKGVAYSSLFVSTTVTQLLIIIFKTTLKISNIQNINIKY